MTTSDERKAAERIVPQEFIGRDVATTELIRAQVEERTAEAERIIAECTASLRAERDAALRRAEIAKHFVPRPSEMSGQDDPDAPEEVQELIRLAGEFWTQPQPTVMTIDSDYSFGNERAAKALKELRKSRNQPLPRERGTTKGE